MRNKQFSAEPIVTTELLSKFVRLLLFSDLFNSIKREVKELPQIWDMKKLISLICKMIK